MTAPKRPPPRRDPRHATSPAPDGRYHGRAKEPVDPAPLAPWMSDPSLLPKRPPGKEERRG